MAGVAHQLGALGAARIAVSEDLARQLVAELLLALVVARQHERHALGLGQRRDRPQQPAECAQILRL